MAMKIEKNSSKWLLHGAFVQGNPVKGYEYLDRSGAVLNKIGDMYNQRIIDPGGCLLSDRKDIKDPYSIRFSPNRIWLHYVSTDSLKYVIDTAPQWIQSIARDINVTHFSRLGLRVEYFAPSSDIISTSLYISKKISGDIFHSLINKVDSRDDVDIEYRLRVPLHPFMASVRIGIIKTSGEPRTPVEYSSDGLIFDVDVYRRSKKPEGLPRAETKSFLSQAVDKIYYLLEEIGYSVLEVSDGTKSDT
jgi:hypothetical protein